MLAGTGTNWGFPLYAGERATGILLLNIDLSQIPEADFDSEAVAHCTRMLGRAFENLRATDQTELIQRMPSGLAHDIKNLLIPVSTFLQRYERSPSPELPNEFFRLAFQHLEMITSYVTEALTSPSSHTPDIRRRRLRPLAEAVVGNLETHLRNKRLQVRLAIPETLEAHVDSLLFQRLTMNLVLNAS